MRNPLELLVIGLSDLTDKINKGIEGQFGVNLMQKLGESIQEEERWAKENPKANIAKQLTKGTLNGVLGVGGVVVFSAADQAIKKLKRKL